MEETSESRSRQHLNDCNAPTIHRDLTCQAIEASKNGNDELIGNESIDKSQRDVDSFLSILGENDSSWLWTAIQVDEQDEKKLQTSVPQAMTSEGDDMSFMLDIKRIVSGFSDEKSDGISRSSVSPTPSESSSANSSSPLLRRSPSAAFETPYCEHSVSYSQANPCGETMLTPTDLMQDSKLEAQVESLSSRNIQHDDSQKVEEIADENEKDLPDWLRERIVLSPTSIPKSSARSPQQIEHEIQCAVDSASARVQKELRRQEQLQNELLLSAAAQPVVDDASKLVENSVKKAELIPEDLLNVHYEMDDKWKVDQDIDTSNGNHGTLLLVMEVLIGDGRMETIDIHDGDNVDALALAFAQKHALQPDAVSKLKVLIREQVDALVETEQGELLFSVEPAGGSVADLELDSARKHASEYANVAEQAKDREHDRELSYNNMMAKYGLDSQRRGKVDFYASGSRPFNSKDTSGLRYTQEKSAVATPTFAKPIQSSRSFGQQKKVNLADAPAYERLHALAASKNKWIQRAQKAKEMEQTRDHERLHQIELMAAKSRELVANRTNRGYAHIGDRLHDEALSDIAKKVQRHERRVAEREQQHDWMCPKCAYWNQYSDSQCQNVVARTGKRSKGRVGQIPASSNTGRREPSNEVSSSSIETRCGHLKPEQLFQPTLLASSSRIVKAVSANKTSTSQMATLRRQRHQSNIEAEFQDTCPFKPKLNKVSEKIVREKLETAALTAAMLGKTHRQRNPHFELYENSFHARATREENEEKYFKQFPFKPDIGVNALLVTPSKCQGDFGERLAVEQFHELERKRVALNEKYASDRDPHTGKELFKPEIGRGPVLTRNKQGLPIGEFLYGTYREQQDIRRRVREKEELEIKKKAQQTFVSEISRQALKRRKADTCSRIFNKLLALSHQSAQSSVPVSASCTVFDSNLTTLGNHDKSYDTEQEENDELVLSTRVDLAALPVEIAHVVAIIFEYANHEPISRGSFAKHMDRLVGEVPGITYSQIHFLAEHLQNDKSEELHQSQLEHLADDEQKELTFHPAINKNSRKIVTKLGRVSSSKVFDALNQYHEHYFERKEQLLQQQKREFKKTHPFHPTLVTNAHIREPAAAAFYDKILTRNSDGVEKATLWRNAPTVSASRALHQSEDATRAPFQTASFNTRPYVRPIENNCSRNFTVVSTDEIQLEETSGNMSRNSSTSQFLEDAELTSRVLAALEEKPTGVTLSPSYHLLKTLVEHDDKASSSRSPEVTN